MKPRVPPQSFASQLLDHLGEIIAQRPPQQFGWEPGNPIGKIIAERIAGLPPEQQLAVLTPPEQRLAVAQLILIEILITRPEVPLIGILRRHVALELAQRWIPKREWNKICQERELTPIEALYSLAKLGRKDKAAWAKAGKPLPEASKKTALEAVADAVGKEPEALARSLRPSRRTRKKPRL
jgi:hypothetical protein